MKKYPPTVIWTSEFDFLRRDNEKFAGRLQKVGRLVDISIMPGVGHAFQTYNFFSQENKWFYEEEKMAFNTIFR